MSSIERQFAEAMMSIYRRAYREAKYNATVFHQMLTDHGGLETARILIHAEYCFRWLCGPVGTGATRPDR